MNRDRVLGSLQAALDVVFGLRKPDPGIKHFSTLRDVYGYYTGDGSLHGVFDPRRLPSELRASMAITSSTFPNALANTLNRFLSVGYSKINFFEDVLISQKSPATHLDQGSFTALGCWADLPDADPETEDYPDMANITEAVNTFDLLQKGCVVPISRRVFVNDDVGLLKKLGERLGLVGRKTHARYCWNFFINNSNTNDGNPWFTTGHGNLGTEALSDTAIMKAITALANLVEPGPSTDVVGLDLTNFKWHLVVPIALWPGAVVINQKKGSACYRLFGANNERIVTPPFLSDTNDWGVVRSVEDVPILEMQYIDGKKEPEIFFEHDERSDMAIRGDWFGLKCRFEFGGALSDYRGAFKFVVP